MSPLQDTTSTPKHEVSRDNFPVYSPPELAFNTVSGGPGNNGGGGGNNARPLVVGGRGEEQRQQEVYGARKASLENECNALERRVHELKVS